jgi:excisionase family DNA binding protein
MTEETWWEKMNLFKKKDEPVLHVREVAKLLNCAEITIYRFVQQRNRLKIPIPCHRVGRRWIFYKTEIVNWVKSL